MRGGRQVVGTELGSDNRGVGGGGVEPGVGVSLVALEALGPPALSEGGKEAGGGIGGVEGGELLGGGRVRDAPVEIWRGGGGMEDNRIDEAVRVQFSQLCLGEGLQVDGVGGAALEKGNGGEEVVGGTAEEKAACEGEEEEERYSEVKPPSASCEVGG